MLRLRLRLQVHGWKTAVEAYEALKVIQDRVEADTSKLERRLVKAGAIPDSNKPKSPSPAPEPEINPFEDSE
ncbi:hypothetical protein N7528_004224 [Penicillium herquei]|nr:hypothetical protein N7528_004224 [Penicillium herquei]